MILTWAEEDSATLEEGKRVSDPELEVRRYGGTELRSERESESRQYGHDMTRFDWVPPCAQVARRLSRDWRECRMQGTPTPTPTHAL